MSDTPTPAPDLTKFERTQAELDTVLARLEDPEAPLQERLALHVRAVRLQELLEATLERARETLEEPVAPPGAAPDPDFPQGAEEPYESVLARLGDTVREMTNRELPLARVIELRRTALRLVARCESILAGVQEELDRSASGSDAASPPGPPPPAVPPKGDEAPF